MKNFTRCLPIILLICLLVLDPSPLSEDQEDDSQVVERGGNLPRDLSALPVSFSLKSGVLLAEGCKKKKKKKKKEKKGKKGKLEAGDESGDLEDDDDEDEAGGGPEAVQIPGGPRVGGDNAQPQQQGPLITMIINGIRSQLPAGSQLISPSGLPNQQRQQAGGGGGGRPPVMVYNLG